MAYDKENPKQNWLPEYVRAIADDFGLRDWSFIFSEVSPDDPETSACTFCTEGRKHATFWFSDSFWKENAEEQRAQIVHELLHCHFAATQHWCRKQFSPTDHGAFVLMHEYSVDGLADAISNKFPLPPTSQK